MEQLSKEWAYGYSSGFALEPDNAILNFTINGLAASAEVAVVFTIYDYGEIYATITGNVTTDASGTATYAIGVADGTELKDCTLTLGGNAVTLVSSSKNLEAGKIYNITRSVAPAETTVTWNTTNVFNEDHEYDKLSQWYPDPLTMKALQFRLAELVSVGLKLMI